MLLNKDTPAGLFGLGDDRYLVVSTNAGKFAIAANGIRDRFEGQTGGFEAYPKLLFSARNGGGGKTRVYIENQTAVG